VVIKIRIWFLIVIMIFDYINKLAEKSMHVITVSFMNITC